MDIFSSNLFHSNLFQGITVVEKVGKFYDFTIYAVEPWPFDKDIIVVESPTYGKYALIKLEDDNG